MKLPKRHMTKKNEQKAVLTALTNVAIKAADKEKKPALSLFLKAEVSNLKKQKTTVAQDVFQLYANLLTKEERHPWDIIVKEQTESSQHTNIFGVKWIKSPGKTPKSFQTCTFLHLQSCLSHDMVETLQFYMMNCLKKPNKVHSSVCTARTATEQLH